MKKKIIITLVVILCIGIIAGCSYVLYNKTKSNPTFLGTDIVNEDIEDQNTIIAQVEEPKTFQGNDRPIAIMIDNNKSAMPQGGLNDAYIVYEIIVEGGESRLMALFKGSKLEKIGSVRSSRHYFLDYALENDAIYVHYGWSPKAETDIKTLSVNNINGISETTNEFWRVKDKKAPHNVATSIEKIMSIANKKGYRTTSTSKSILNYTTENVILENGQTAQNIKIPYSDSNIVRWEYSAENSKYIRYSKNNKQKDWTTGEDVAFKNIIIEFIANTDLKDGENKGRQDLNTVGTKEGYYITNGKAIPIKCEKTSRTSKTKYVDLEGNEIDVNDGNTFIQICPINAKVTIE